MDYDEISSESESLGSQDTISTDYDSGSDTSLASGEECSEEEVEPGLQKLVSDLPPVPYHQGGSSTEFNQEIWRGTQVDRNLRGGTSGRESASSRFYSPSQPISFKRGTRLGYTRGHFQSPLREARQLPGNQKYQKDFGIRNKEGKVSGSWRSRSYGRLGEKGFSIPANRGRASQWENSRRDQDYVPMSVLFEKEGDSSIPLGCTSNEKSRGEAKDCQRSPRGSHERYLNVLSDLAEGKSLDARFEEEKAAAEALISMRTSRDREESSINSVKRDT